MSKEITIKGLEEVLDRFESLADTQNIKAAMGKACAVVEGSAKRNAPKGDGHLRRSITSEVEETRQGVEGVVYTALEYAPYVEYGTGLFAEDGGRQDVPWCYQDEKGNWHTTSGMHPRPFIRPALYDNRETIKRILKEGLNND